MELRGGHKDQPPSPGQQISANLRLRPITSFANPGSPDWVRIRALEDVHAVVYLGAKAQARLSGEQEFSVSKVVEQVRQQWGGLLDKLEPSPARGLIRALTLGQRSEAGNEMRNDFSEQGIAHLLSISGLHLSFIWDFCLLALNFIFKRSTYLLLHFNVARPSASLAFMPTLAYALLGGASTPTLRALIMSACLVASLWVRRSYQISGGLCLAALLLCGLWPETLFTVSFQLSFIAVCAIIVVAQPFTGFIKNKYALPAFVAYILGFLAFNAAVTVFIWPLTVLTFHQVPWLSVFANAIFIPVVGLLGSRAN